MNDQKGKQFRKGIHYTVSIQNPWFQLVQDLQKDGSITTESTKPGTWADIDEKLSSIEWDWPGWLPKGFFTIVVGKPGIGKSFLLLRIAACYCQGLDWPDGSKFMNELGLVLWCEAEAAQKIQLNRARKLGFPKEGFYYPLEDFYQDVDLGNPKHMERIRWIANRSDVSLVIVDSLRGAHQKDEDSSRMMEIVKSLATLARDVNKPVLVSHHPRKLSQYEVIDEVTLDRVRGSSAIIQPARMIWALDLPNPDVKENLRLHVIKSNLEEYPKPIGVRITKMGIQFGESAQPRKKETKTERAITLLQKLLENGPVPEKEIEEAFSKTDISMSTVKIAGDKMRIEKNKIGGDNGYWSWSLPQKDANEEAI